MDIDIDMIFATIVGVLAALAVIGALVFVIVAEVVAIHHKLTANRHGPPPGRWTPGLCGRGRW
jgi:hypothetical protein